MDQSSDHFSNEQLINGLRNVDPSALEAIFHKVRPTFLREINALGGSDATGKVFFRAAVLDAARMASGENFSPEEPLDVLLKQLGTAHFMDWLVEKGQAQPESAPPESTPGFPDSESLRATRKKIDSWKNAELIDDPAYPLWEKIRIVERKLAGEGEPKPKSNFARNLLIFFLLLTAIYVVYRFFNRSQSPAEIYQYNFTPPESLMADRKSRYGPELGNDSVSTDPGECTRRLREADEYYKAKNFELAETTLFDILDDSLALCSSDALFYIGVIALEQEKPTLALECFSKIEDLEHFGEDIYWYQALAMVQLADINPLLKDKARRAVERAHSNAVDSLRRTQTERMLKHLSD
ncbi:MAG: hypothetical protein IPJ82_08430 [Lewinellaceae bacterium]|nr:hypothetical protein [Lewinellaceae bacterium]